MCPDNDTPDTGNTAPAEQNPTLAEDDTFRRKIEVAEGPNKDGYDTMVKAAHPERDGDGKPIAPQDDTVKTEPAMNAVLAKVESTPGTDPVSSRDIEPSMPAPDAPHVPDVPLEG